PPKPPIMAPAPALPDREPTAAPAPAPKRPPDAARSPGVVPQAAKARAAVTAAQPAKVLNVSIVIFVPRYGFVGGNGALSHSFPVSIPRGGPLDFSLSFFEQ